MMTDREKLVGLVKEICNTVVKACGCSDMLPTYSFCKNAVYESFADYLITNGVTVQPSPQNNHRKICSTTGLECIECVPGSPCAKMEVETNA